MYVPPAARFAGRVGLLASTVAVNQLARHPVMGVPEAVSALAGVLASLSTDAVTVVTDCCPWPLLVTVNGRNWVLLVAPG